VRSTHHFWAGLKLQVEHEFRSGEGPQLKGSEAYTLWLNETGLKSIHYTTTAFEKAFGEFQLLKQALPKAIHPATGIHTDENGVEYFRMVYFLPGNVTILPELVTKGADSIMRVTGKVCHLSSLFELRVPEMLFLFLHVQRIQTPSVTTNLFFSGDFKGEVLLPTGVDTSKLPVLQKCDGEYVIDCPLKKQESVAIRFEFTTITKS